MCPNRYVFVSKSIQFWLTIILGILLPFYDPPWGFDVDFLPKGTRFRPTFWLRVHVFDAFWCPSWLAPWHPGLLAPGAVAPLASWLPGLMRPWPSPPWPLSWVWGPGTVQINSDVSQNEQLTVGFQGIDSYVILGDVSRGGFNLI